MVLFVLLFVSEYQWQMAEISSANGDLVKHSQFLEQEQLLMKVVFNNPFTVNRDAILSLVGSQKCF